MNVRGSFCVAVPKIPFTIVWVSMDIYMNLHFKMFVLRKVEIMLFEVKCLQELNFNESAEFE